MQNKKQDDRRAVGRVKGFSFPWLDRASNVYIVNALKLPTRPQDEVVGYRKEMEEEEIMIIKENGKVGPGFAARGEVKEWRNKTTLGCLDRHWSCGGGGRSRGSLMKRCDKNCFQDEECEEREME